jgi:peptide deformylase
MPRRRPAPDPYAFPFRADRPALSLVHADHPALHRVGDPAAGPDPRLDRLLDRLLRVCEAAPGVGVAAPQVGVPLRVAIVWPPAADDGRDEDAPVERPAAIELVDPEIVETEGEIVWAAEACLSLPLVRGLEVRRPRRIVVRAADRRGRVRTLEATGFVAEIFAHEIDHLDGILYPSRAESIEYALDHRPHHGDED